jgi:tetratricopeptide (TPR) repeat protein
LLGWLGHPVVNRPNKEEAATLAAGATGAAPLVGRDAILSQLDEIFQSAVTYQAPQLITLLGTQGVGKSRLLAEWLHRLVGRYPAGTPGRPRVYRGRASQGAGSYALINRLLRDRFHVAEGDDEKTREEKVRTQLTDVFGDRRMTEVLHFLGRYLELRSEVNAFIRAVSFGDDARREDSISRTVLRRFLELDAERSPLILAFDDLHLADDDSLVLCGELAEGLGGSPVVMIAAARAELFVRCPAWGAGETDHTRIDLGALDRPDAEKMLRALLTKAEPLPAALVDDLCELTGGNPFFLEEVVRTCLTNGTIVVSQTPGGERWRIDGARAAQVELPMSVEEAIEARISALRPDERALLERAATLGSVFWTGALVVLGRLEAPRPPEGAGSEERARLETLLAGLVERDYLLRMPDSTVPGEHEFIFKHNLEHDLIQKLIPPERARRYYLGAAAWLETRLPPGEQSGEQLEYLGQLYDKGGHPARAAHAYLVAADKARARYANENAAELYERALRLIPVEDLLARIDPLHNYGDVLSRAGRGEEALKAFREMLEAAWRIDHHAKAGAAHGRIGRIHRGRGELAEAEKHFQWARELFEAALDTRGLAAAEDDLGRVAFVRGDYGAALERHERALDLRRALGDKRSIALSLHNLAQVHHAAGSPSEAVTSFGQALELRREIGDRTGVVESLLAMASAWRDRDEHARALEVCQEALGQASDIGDRVMEAQVLTRLGEVLVKLGRFDEAQKRLTEAAERAGVLGDKLLLSEGARIRAELHLARNELREARGEARAALELAEKVGSLPAEASAHRLLGEIISEGGITDEDRSQADQHFSRAIEILNEVGYERELGFAFESYSHVLSIRGDIDGARTLAERADEITRRRG